MDEAEILKIGNALSKWEFPVANEEETEENELITNLKTEIASLKQKVDAEKKVIAELDAEISTVNTSIAEVEDRKKLIEQLKHRRRLAKIPLHETDYNRVEAIQKRALALEALTGVTLQSFTAGSGILRGYVKNRAGRLEYFSVQLKDQEKIREKKVIAADIIWSIIERSDQGGGSVEDT